jgi:hypothetical protein
MQGGTCPARSVPVIPSSFCVLNGGGARGATNGDADASFSVHAEGGGVRAGATPELAVHGYVRICDQISDSLALGRRHKESGSNRTLHA